MKKIICLSLLCVLFASCKEKSFDENLKASNEAMESLILFSALACDKTSETWRDAIYDHKDHKGNYCSDFNDALRTLRNFYSERGVYDTIRVRKSRMEEYASKLNNPPSSRKDCYNDYIAIVAEVIAFSRMATDPEGSLKSYNEATNKSYTNIRKMRDQFRIKYGDILKKE